MTTDSVALLLIRHGPTLWNVEHRLQGRTDKELSVAGRAQVGRWQVPVEFRDFHWVCSSMLRTCQTAQLLGASETRLEPRIQEMKWGEWEGHTVAELRAGLGPEVQANEDRGLDFQPPGGESPRHVKVRLKSWLHELAAHGQPTAAVIHKGVIRALLALATSWNMLGKAPQKLDWNGAHLFRV